MLVSTGQGVLGSNMFAYCENNPVKYSDLFGYVKVCLPIESGGETRPIEAANKTNLYNRNKRKSFLGTQYSATSSTSVKSQDYLFSIASVETEASISTINSSCNDNSYIVLNANQNVDNPISDSSAGIRMNISSVTIGICVGLRDTGIFVEDHHNDSGNGMKLRLNMLDLRVGVEEYTMQTLNGVTGINSTYYSVSGKPLILILYMIISQSPDASLGFH